MTWGAMSVSARSIREDLLQTWGVGWVIWGGSKKRGVCSILERGEGIL